MDLVKTYRRKNVSFLLNGINGQIVIFGVTVSVSQSSNSKISKFCEMQPPSLSSAYGLWQHFLRSANNTVGNFVANKIAKTKIKHKLSLKFFILGCNFCVAVSRMSDWELFLFCAFCYVFQKKLCVGRRECSYICEMGNIYREQTLREFMGVPELSAKERMQTFHAFFYNETVARILMRSQYMEYTQYTTLKIVRNEKSLTYCLYLWSEHALY